MTDNKWNAKEVGSKEALKKALENRIGTENFQDYSEQFDFIVDSIIDGKLSSGTIDFSKVVTSLQVELSRVEMLGSESVTVSRTITDWKISDRREPVEEPDDDVPHKLTAIIGNQIYIDVEKDEDNYRLGVIIEIDKGVPTVHIATEEDSNIIHIHCVDHNLIITPSSDVQFSNADVDKFSYNSNTSLSVGYRG